MKTTDIISPARTGRASFIAGTLERFLRRLRFGTLEILLPDGERVLASGAERHEVCATWQLSNYKPFIALAARGAMGFAESYLAGDWDTPDLPALVYLAALNEREFGRGGDGLSLFRWPDRIWHARHRNSRRQAQQNIAEHYDLGNAFYASWLDSTMTYSSALFEDGETDLGRAQQRKYARLAEMAGLDEADPAARPRVLEIGCGWGGFLEHAARQHRADVTGVSISRAQCDYVDSRLARAGLSAHARAAFRDYRDLSGQWPHIVSIEMFEAVGEAYWPVYANKLKSLLAPGGHAAIQVITIEDDRFESYRRRPDFIQRYVFPGGMLPSESRLASTLGDAGLKVTDRLRFGADYARTLAAWRDRFDAAWPQIEQLGFDARFRRLWHFYLAYCEAGFRCGAVDVVQFRIEHA